MSLTSPASTTISGAAGSNGQHLADGRQFSSGVCPVKSRALAESIVHHSVQQLSAYLAQAGVE